MIDEIKVLKSIALRGCQKYGSIRRGIKDLTSINNYEADTKSNETTGDLLEANDSNTWIKYKNNTTEDATDTERTREDLRELSIGGRYGLDPQHAQNNGSFFIDALRGKIHFTSNLSGKTVTLKYISDSLGTLDEIQVHKFAEEAVYKSIAYAILVTRSNVPPVIVQQFKKERFAETRKAKLRLSNYKLEELAQIMRGKSKQIKS